MSTSPAGPLVCLDVGKSTIKACVVTPHEERSLLLPSPGLLAADGVPARIVEAVAAAGSGLLAGGPFDVCAAVAGVDAYPAAAAGLRAALQEWCGGGEVLLASDVVAAYASAFPGDERGCVLVAGTGSVAMALDAAGRAHRSDGLGPLLGDSGSGFWLGREGLRVAAEAGPDSVLRQLAEREYGPIGELPERLARVSNWVAVVARFAPHVMEAAAGGDEPSRRLVGAAADRLHDTAARACSAAGVASVALVGGLLAAADGVLRDEVSARLTSSGLSAVLVAGDGLLGTRRFPALRHRYPLLFAPGTDGSSRRGRAR